MKYLVFTRENNNFEDVLNDPAIKRKFKTKISYTKNLILGFPEEKTSFDKTHSYIKLKYGNDVKEFSSLVKDRSPIPNVEYTPKRLR